MPSLPWWKKPKAPVEPFGLNFEAALHRFGADFLQSRQFKHSSARGEQREEIIIKFFSDLLPSRYTVTSGQAVDLHGEYSPQLDLMIFDASRNFRSREKEGMKQMIRIESFIAYLLSIVIL